MKVTGLITEYNPFHNGHLYHLIESKKISDCDHTIVVMSGNFVQRGVPSLIDKWTKAKMAIDNGADLIIELPTIYAVQSAEFFASGAIKTLDSTGIVDSIVFGSEIGDLSLLEKIVDVLIKEPPIYVKVLKFHLNKGDSFPLARSKSLEEYFKNHEDISKDCLVRALSSPNNILAIEYLKALKRINSTMTPYTITRVESDYNSNILSGSMSSASAIRNHILKHNDLELIDNSIPYHTHNHLNNFFEKYKSFNSLDNYSQVLLYLLKTTNSNELKNILDVDRSLVSRITKCSAKYNSVSDILNCIKTKRYTYTRLQRILIHLLLKINSESFLELHNNGPQYIRVLGCNRKGLDLLKEMKTTSKVPIITKFANYRNLNNPLLEKMIHFDINATNIYFLGLRNFNEPKFNLDYLTNPYIKL